MISEQEKADLVTQAKAALAVAKDDLEAAVADLVALKEVCVRDCAEVTATAVAARDAYYEKPSQETEDALHNAALAEEVVHQEHGPALEAAYARVGRLATAEENIRRAEFGLQPKGSTSNPAPAGVTELSTSIAAAGSVAAQ